MSTRPSCRVAPVADTSRHGIVVAASTLLHAAVLMTLWRAGPPPARDMPPVLELAFAAPPVPPAQPTPEPAAPALPVPQPPPPAPVAPIPPGPVSPVDAAPAVDHDAAPTPPSPEPPPPEPPKPAASMAPAQHPALIPKVSPKPSRPRPRPILHAVASAPPMSSSMPDRPVTAEEAPIPSAPVAPAIASPAWQSEVGSWLRAHKTYPDEARRDMEQGRVSVRFTIQRDGMVTEVTLLHSSGSAALDAAAQALLRGAHLPPFPPGMAQAQQTISLGISYTLDP
jgi:protein TonB